MWQSNLLSQTRRAQLIKSVLRNLTSYYLSIFRIPNKVAKQIIALQRRFFWGGKDESNRMATISWPALEAPKELGGLGFKNIKIQNLELLAKWWWKFSDSNNTL